MKLWLKLHEPPCTDPYARWCGRAKAAKPSPIPIDDHRMRYGFTHGDIRDDALLDRLFDEEAFDGVIHFGAESHVDRSILGPTAFLETNVIGTFRLLEGALRYWRNRGRPENFRFLHISTDEVYGSLGGEGRFTEKTPYDPSSP